VPSVRYRVREAWEKNWPEIHAALTGNLPEFVLAARPHRLEGSVPAFCYHVVTWDALEADLAFLSLNDYTTLDADGLLDHLGGCRPAPERSVVLTFDDGARNLHEVVWPLLKRHQMQAVAFVAPRFHPEIARPDDHALPCGWDQIIEMHASGALDFQSHTFEHRYVIRWPEPAPLRGTEPDSIEALLGPALAMEDDFRLAREILEERLTKPVHHLAFPKHNGTDEAVAIAKRSGYRACWGRVPPHRADNRPGGPTDQIVRINGEFLRRLPGKGRRSLSEILFDRHRANAARLLRRRRAA
jgi:peptidoglycan/xylan/chitin deacetylase (PgdA/CDA1 family)